MRAGAGHVHVHLIQPKPALELKTITVQFTHGGKYDLTLGPFDLWVGARTASSKCILAGEGVAVYVKPLGNERMTLFCHPVY